MYRNVAIAGLREAKAIRVTDYCGEPFIPPAWRERRAQRLDMPRMGMASGRCLPGRLTKSAKRVVGSDMGVQFLATSPIPTRSGSPGRVQARLAAGDAVVKPRFAAPPHEELLL